MDVFGKRLSYILTERGITQRKLAKMCRITESTICRYINGSITPKATEVVTIAKSLGVSTDYLSGMPESKEMTVKELLRKLDILTNDTNLSLEECINFYRAKAVVQRIYEGSCGK